MASPLSSISEPRPDRYQDMDYYWTDRSFPHLPSAQQYLHRVRMDTARSFLKQPSAWKSKYCAWFAGSLFWRVTGTQLRWGTQCRVKSNQKNLPATPLQQARKKLWWMECGQIWGSSLQMAPYSWIVQKDTYQTTFLTFYCLKRSYKPAYIQTAIASQSICWSIFTMILLNTC